MRNSGGKGDVNILFLFCVLVLRRGDQTKVVKVSSNACVSWYGMVCGILCIVGM